MLQVPLEMEKIMKETVNNSMDSVVELNTKSALRRANVRRKAMQTAMDFDKLPDSAYVHRSVAEVLFDCSKSTVLRKIKKSVLPPPRQFGSSVLHLNVGELRSVMRSSQRNS